MREKIEKWKGSVSLLQKKSGLRIFNLIRHNSSSSCQFSLKSLSKHLLRPPKNIWRKSLRGKLKEIRRNRSKISRRKKGRKGRNPYWIGPIQLDNVRRRKLSSIFCCHGSWYTMLQQERKFEIQVLVILSTLQRFEFQSKKWSVM